MWEDTQPRKNLPCLQSWGGRILQWILLARIHAPGWSLPCECGVHLVTFPLGMEWDKSGRMWLPGLGWNLVTLDYDFHLAYVLLLTLLSPRLWDKTSCHVMRWPTKRSMYRRAESGFQPTAHEELRIETTTSEPGSGSFQIKACGGCNPMRTSEPEAPSKPHACISDSQKLWDNAYCCFKMLNT